MTGSPHDPSRQGRLLWLRQRTRGFRLIQRVDPVLVSVVLGAALALTVVEGIRNRLASDDPSTERVRDDRILGSFTARRGCHVATATDADGLVWTSLRPDPRCRSTVASGGVAPFDPVWRTWGSEQQPFSGDVGSIDPATLARLGDRLWIAGDDGGIAVRDGRTWRAWLSQSAFRVGDRPVEGRDIAAAATFDQGVATILVTRAGQVGHYDAATARWTDLGSLPGTGEIRQVLQQGDVLWLGRGSGLWRIPVLQGKLRLDAAEQRLDRRVLQASAADGALIALVKAICTPPGAAAACVQLLRLDVSGNGTEVLLDTTAAPHDWRAADVAHAAVLGDRLVLAGPKGAMLYDRAARAWARIEVAAVALFAADGGRAVAFGGADYVARIDAGATQPLRVALPPGSGGVQSLGFDPDGGLHLSDATATLWHQTPRGTLAERFR